MKKNIFFLLIVALACLSYTYKDTHSDSLRNNLKQDGLKNTERDSLLKIIAIQNQDISEFKSLKDEMTAKKVFDDSKKYLISWITANGLLLLVVIIIGYFQIKDYIINVVKKRIEDEGKGIIQKESHEQISSYLEKNKIVEKIAEEVESRGTESINKLVGSNKKVFDDLAETAKKDLQNFLNQLEQSRQALKNPLGEKVIEREIEPVKKIPEKVDYSALMNPIRDQENIGSVVGFALASTMEFFIQKQINKMIILSPLFIYYHTRKMKGLEKSDSGARIKDAIKVAETIGIVTEDNWPYDVKKIAIQPPKKIDKSPHYFISSAIPVKNLKQIKNALATFGPIIIGISVYDSFTKSPDGIINIPDSKEKIIGATAICIVGFEDETHLFKFRNSWGTKWGDKGYGYISYDYVEKFSDDGWVIKSISEKIPG
jgi:Cysteine protease